MMVENMSPLQIIDDELALMMEQARVHGRAVIFFNRFLQNVRTERKIDVRRVARDYNYVDARIFLNVHLNAEFNENGDIKVPPAPAFSTDVFYKGIDEEKAKKQAKKQQLRIFYNSNYNKAPKPTTSHGAVDQENADRAEHNAPRNIAPESRNRLYVYDGNMFLRPGMPVRVNGITYFLPLIPEFYHNTDETERIQQTARINFGRMIKEIKRQYAIQVAEETADN